MEARIVLLPGDGVGPEVTAAAARVLTAVAERGGHRLALPSALIGAAALDAVGRALPEDTLAACAAADAVLLGAVGDPRRAPTAAGERPEEGLLALRRHFGLFANLRPVPLFPALAERAPLKRELLAGVDLLVVRELTGGLYFGPRQEQGDGDVAYDTMVYRRHEVERVAHVAFRLARQRRRRLASVDKANVLASMRLWRRTVEEVAAGYPDVALEHVLVDACAMRLIAAPASFDVLLAGNLFGDVLSDEAAVLAGSLGMLPSAALGEGSFGLYEPVHGAAPDLAGRGVANPVGAILSAALLLRHSLGLGAEARAVEGAVAATLAAGVWTADVAPPAGPAVSTAGWTEALLERLGTA